LRPQAGHIDICFNLIGHCDVHGTPLIDMDLEDFVRPIDSIVRSTFLTSQATRATWCARRLPAAGGAGGRPIVNGASPWLNDEERAARELGERLERL
jgi:hypothetical protein